MQNIKRPSDSILTTGYIPAIIEDLNDTMSGPVKKLHRRKQRRNEGQSHSGFWTLNIAGCEFYIRNIKRFTLCALLLICFLGCYSTEVVKIKTIVDSKIDMRKYKNIAVIDLINSRENEPATQGAILARMIRKQLAKSKDFHVLDEKTIYMRLGEEINKDKIEDPNALIRICNQLGADAIIVGMFNFYQINQAVPYIVERYSSRTGQYRPETRTYIQGVYRLSIHIKLMDGATGKTIFDHTPPVEERPKLGSSWALPLPDSKADSTNLRGMASKPVSSFVLSLVPHYEYEKRILAR